MLRARGSMSDRERDVTRFLAELHHRIEETQSLEAGPARETWRELERREKELAREWEKRETAKLKELERRTDAGAGEVRGAGAGDHRQESRKAPRSARRSRRRSAGSPRRNANCARIFRPRCLPPQDDSRRGECSPLRVEEGARVRLRDVREPARVRRVLGNGRIEVEAGFMKMQVSMDDVIEVLPESSAASKKLPQERELPAGAGTGAGAPGDQRDRPARRGSARRGGRISGPRRDGHRQPRPHRARPRHGHSAQEHPGDAGPPSRTWPSSTRRRSRKAGQGRRLWS